MHHLINQISNRLSLRKPQKEALEFLAQACDHLSLDKGADIEEQLRQLRKHLPQIKDFERSFPSLCFSLATGVGKTRLMGAFISYLAQIKGIRHFLILAPNLTVYNKLRKDFTLGSEKYVFEGLTEFATTPPVIIDADNWKRGYGVRVDRRLQPELDLFGDRKRIHINIFNISKLHSGPSKRQIKSFQEYLGTSYFEYLSTLEDLVVLMDEAHRYRAEASMRVIDEMKPVLGIELTATPQVMTSKGSVRFANVLYDYPLSLALRDGFVKEPAVAGREDLDISTLSREELEDIKLRDGIGIHEDTKTKLNVYALQNNERFVKPFVLIVAKDTEHANLLFSRVSSSDFFEGQYINKVILTHSCQTPEDEDLFISQLLSIESPDNPFEIVIHVNKLAEGWDVNNLYTIIPLRPANSRNLIEQCIGRGLRLPYGRCTGNASVDRLTIVSHDKFAEIVSEANRPDSIIRHQVIIEQEISPQGLEILEVHPTLSMALADNPLSSLVLSALPELCTENISHEVSLVSPVMHRALNEKIQEKVTSSSALDLKEIIEQTLAKYQEFSIDIPRIVIQPKIGPTFDFDDFNLDLSHFSPQPLSHTVVAQNLRDGEQEKLFHPQDQTNEPPKNRIIRGLVEYPDVCYDRHSSLLHKLSSQVIEHLREYLNEGQVALVVHQFCPQIVELVHSQMQRHQQAHDLSFEVKVTHGFVDLKPSVYTMPRNSQPQHYLHTVVNKQEIRKFVFTGFKKSLYPYQKFDSDKERIFAAIMEKADSPVRKWLKPTAQQLRIYHSLEEAYEPDFIAETDADKFLIEIKRHSEINTDVVQRKARAARTWCSHANQVGHTKPWTYVLIPDDNVDLSGSFTALIRKSLCFLAQ